MFKNLDSGISPERVPWPRKVSRAGIATQVVLRRPGLRTFQVNVVDISTHGCKAEFVERPNLDELVTIKFPGLESLYAVVCWVRDLEMGLEFERPIHPAVFDMIVAQLRPQV